MDDRARALSALISPKSIAIVGASPDFRKINGRPLGYLLEKGYRGSIYPVNPKYREIAGLPCYPRASDIPGDVDLAIVAVPAKDVVATIEDLGAKRVPAAIVFSSGFAETGAAGAELERRAREAAARNGVCLCGPNCLGLVNAFERVIASFSQYAAGDTPAGPVGFVSQSGAFGTAIAALARTRGIGLGYFVNTGNEADVTFSEVMRHVLDDPRVRVGAGYIEGVKDGPGLIATAEHALALGKPLVVTKVGRMAAGSRAAASHTGSLAGEDRVFDAVARQHAIMRARNEEHMLDLVEVLATCSLPDGRGVGMVTQSGGAGVLMADRVEELGLEVAQLGERTRAALQTRIPGFGTIDNPVDITGQFLAEPRLMLDSLSLVLEDPAVHVGIVWLQLMHGHVDTLVDLFRQVKATASKPFVVVWVSAPEPGLAALRAEGIPVLRGADPAVEAVAGLIGYAEARRRWLADARDRRAIDLPLLDLPRRAGVVPTVEATALLQRSGVPLVAASAAHSAEEAVQAARALGYPVAAKIESPDILHKTEADGVRLGLADDAAVRQAFASLLAGAQRHLPGARVDGVIVQQMAHGAAELVVGLKNDPVFGNVVMVGLGGIHVEILRDVSFRRCPVTPLEAGRMLDELRGAALLREVRGRPPLDRGAMIEAICAVSRFGASAGPRLEELDLNPVLVDVSGAAAVDVVLVLRGRDGQPSSNQEEH